MDGCPRPDLGCLLLQCVCSCLASRPTRAPVGGELLTLASPPCPAGSATLVSGCGRSWVHAAHHEIGRNLPGMLAVMPVLCKPNAAPFLLTGCQLAFPQA